jgi:hypothetical protein
MTERLLNTTTFEPSFAKVHEALRVIEWSSFSGFRNRVMYVGSFWPLSEVVDANGLDCHPEIFAAVGPTQDVIAPFADYYFTVGKLFRSILQLMLADISMFAPAVSSEAVALQT